MIESVVLAVTDMKCGGCESTITGKLKALPGVISVHASSKNDEIRIEYDDEQTGLDTLKDTINGAGFTVR